MTPANHYFRYYTYIQPALRSPIVKKYGGHTLTIATIIIFIIFAIKPTIETISVLRQKLEDSKQILFKVNQKTENLQLGRKNYQDLGTDTVNKINTAVPLQVSLRGLIEPLESAANINQASISALQIEPISINQKGTNSTYTLDKIVFTFNTEGAFATLLKVLQQVQDSPRLIAIDSVIFTKAPNSKVLLMSINGKAYFLK